MDPVDSPSRALPSTRRRRLDRPLSRVAVIAVVALASVVASGTTGARRLRAAEPIVTAENASPAAGSLATANVITPTRGGNVPGEISEHARWPVQVADAVDGDQVPVDVRPESQTDNRDPEYIASSAGTGVEISNAIAWHEAGIDGTGVRVGVIDFFDVTDNWNVDEHGPTPIAGVTARCFDVGADCTDDLFDGIDKGGEAHGVAVVETILDMAPGAEIFIGQATTVADYRALIDWFASNEVDIINRSLGARYDGPGDGRGALNEIAADAVSRGILWVNSGGNNGEDRYYRHPVRLIGNRVAFGADGTDTFLKLRRCVALGGMRWANDWDKAAADRTDYDLYLWESPTGDPAAGTVVDSSLRDQRGGARPIELLPDNACPKAGSSLYLEVRWVGGDIDGDVLEILDYGGGFTTHTQAAYSAAVSIVDSAERGVIAVGAIDPATGGEIGTYSSQGPTNDGRLAPDVTAPSGFSSSVYGTFAGTSAASPVVAGSAALLLEAGLATGPATLGDLIRNTTLDRGEEGPDQVYGHGEFRLPAPPDPAGVDTRPARFVGLDVPTRLLDTRPDTAVGPTELIGELWPGEILELPVAGTDTIPATGATAVVANLVAVGPDRPSFLQALPTRQASLGGYSNLNTDAADQVRANMAIIPIGDDGSISIYSIARGHVVVDVLGWFEATAGPIPAGRFIELPAAQRLLDTRTDAPVGRLESDATRAVPMPTGVDATQVDSLIVTVTSTRATDPGWIQAYPAARSDVIGSTSTINTGAGESVANTAIVPVGSDGIAVTGHFANGGGSHVVVDMIGYITSDSAPISGDGRFVPVTPNRAFDSRLTSGDVLTKTPQVIYALEEPGSVVPSYASGVMWNLVIVAGARPGFVRGWALGQPEPATSSLNWSMPGETRAGAAISAVTDGGAQFVIYDGSVEPPSPIGDLIADVFGYFT